MSRHCLSVSPRRAVRDGTSHPRPDGERGASTHLRTRFAKGCAHHHVRSLPLLQVLQARLPPRAQRSVPEPSGRRSTRTDRARAPRSQRLPSRRSQPLRFPGHLLPRPPHPQRSSKPRRRLCPRDRNCSRTRNHRPASRLRRASNTFNNHQPHRSRRMELVGRQRLTCSIFLSMARSCPSAGRQGPTESPGCSRPSGVLA